MSVAHITGLPQLNGILNKDNNKLSVIDFHATWCGPCHAIAPFYESLAKKYTNVNFLKCDVDAAKEVASAYSVSAMPTFIFLKGSTKVHQIKGADRSGLESAVQKYASGSSAAFSGKGQTLGGPSTSSPGDLMPKIPGFWSNLDPQAKVLVCLLGAYTVFWWFS